MYKKPVPLHRVHQKPQNENEYVVGLPTLNSFKPILYIILNIKE